MNQSITIKAALKQTASLLTSSDSPLLDSEVLLAHVLNKSRSYFRAWPEKALLTDELNRFSALINQRTLGTPIAYLVGEREFWSRPFKVSPNVLIPRPDTELLIDVVQQKFAAHQPISILDLGTGSGIIAVTLALEFKRSSVTAVDASSGALALAQENALLLNANHIKFIQSDWFSQVPAVQYDLIVSNPPYISSDDPHLFEGDVQFEPSSALISKRNGLQDIESIIAAAKEFLKPEGFLLFEHGFEQGKQVKNLLESSDFKSIEQFQDLQQHTRATIATRP